MHIHYLHTLPSKAKRHMNKLYVFVSDVWCILWDEPLVRQDAFFPEHGATRSTEPPTKDYLVILCSVVRLFMCCVSAEGMHDVAPEHAHTNSCFCPGGIWWQQIERKKHLLVTSRFDQELPICAPCTPVLCGTGAKDYFMHVNRLGDKTEAPCFRQRSTHRLVYFHVAG